MVTLGINMHHDASMCIVEDGKLLSFINTERITRIKKDRELNQEVLDYVLEASNKSFDDIDNIACAYFRPNDFIKMYYVEEYDGFLHKDNIKVDWDRKVESHNKHGGEPLEFGYEFKGELMQLNHPHVNNDGYTVSPNFFYCHFNINRRCIPGYFVNHHLAHNAAAYFTSDYKDACGFSLDGTGVYPIGSSMFCRATEERGLLQHYLPEIMLGTLYQERCVDLGFGDGTFKAGSMMGLAPYGKVLPIAVEMLEEVIAKNFNRKITNRDSSSLRWQWYKLIRNLPIPKEELHYRTEKSLDPTLIKPDSKIGKDLSASVQFQFETGIMKYVKELYDGLPYDNLVLSGGSFLNCTSNGNLRKNGPFKNIYLFPACGDDGTALGAALWTQHQWFKIPRHNWTNKERMYGGREYKKYSSGDLDYEKVIEYLLDDNHVVAWFQGKSEIGPRALCNRSFLADPRNPNIRDHINFNVKNREWFRPFAPVVLAEKANEWFDLEGESPFMLFASQVKKPELIPGVTHVDGSARPQTVTKEDNPKMYKLLKLWEQKTGIPVLLNTSLNLGGEPLVETPEDALDLFYRAKNNSKLSLVINNKIFN
jgi:carbamoyltransferase